MVQKTPMNSQKRFGKQLISCFSPVSRAVSDLVHRTLSQSDTAYCNSALDRAEYNPTSGNMTGIHFLDLPIEIRLMIYSKLLVQSEVIVVMSDSHTTATNRRWIAHLYPQILCVNKTIHSEASPLLYSKNRFHIPFLSLASGHHNVTRFLRQIGSQERLIRYLSITFPRWDYEYSSPMSAALNKGDLNDLGRIRGMFTGITTIELCCDSLPLYIHRNLPVPVEELDMLATRLKAIPSLKKIIIRIQMFPGVVLSDEWMDRMVGYGWIVEVRVVCSGVQYAPVYIHRGVSVLGSDVQYIDV
jgi:hypothetical protein